MRMLPALFLLIALPASATDPEPGCKTAYGKTACGYQCEAAYGEVACAQTPWGTCKAAYGKLVCGDGAPELRNRVNAVPSVTCEAAYGTLACGYSCRAAYGTLRCAQTPEGQCQAAHGQVTCWDPPAPTQSPRGPAIQPVVVVDPRGPGALVVVPVPGVTNLQAADPSTWPPASCTSAYGQTACGYHCKAAFGSIECAQTPFGACEAAAGKVTCWDPPR